MNRLKVLVLGLDGATFDLLRPWAQQGLLPVMQKLLKEGTAGELQSTVPPMTGPAWTSFMTGKNPGKHGLYDWIRRKKHSYGVFPTTADHISEPPLWSLLSQAGRRVCVLNVPMTYPPQPVNGVMISGLPAPSTRVPITHPPELLAEIEQTVGPYLLYPDPGQAYSNAGVDAFIDRLYRTTDTRLRVLEHLRAREDWDFTMLVLNGTDAVQHAMWKYMSPEHPLHDDRFVRYQDCILTYFQYVDRLIGEIVASLDDSTVLMLMSDHGFGPLHKFIHVNNWLRQQGWLSLKPSLKARLKTKLFDLGISPMSVYDLLIRMGLGKLKGRVVRGNGQALLKTCFLSFDDVNWNRTAAYSLGNVGQIYLNVRGREPEGIVEEGSPYQKIRDEIIARLGDLRDPETGERVVQQIFRREEIYWGKHVDSAADIVFIPTRMEYFGFGEHEFGSNMIIESVKRGISGTHRPNGMFLVWGQAAKANHWIQGACITDLAPTILHLMGEPVPSDMDGRVLTQALRPEYAELEPRAASGESYLLEAPVQVEDVFSVEERGVVLERLRSLGYVD